MNHSIMNIYQQLAKIILLEKTDRLPVDYYTDKPELLSETTQDMMIAKVWQARIIPSTELLSALSEQLADKLSPQWTSNWVTVYEFIDSIEQFFKTGTISYFLGKELIPYILKDARLKHLGDFHHVLKRFGQDETQKAFTEGLTKIYFELPLKNEEREALLAPYVSDMNQRFWWEGILEQAGKYPKEAQSFIDYLNIIEEDNKTELIRCLLCGICNTSAKDYFKWIKLIFERHRWEVICALSYTQNQEEDFILSVIDFLEPATVDNTEYQRQMARLYVNFIIYFPESNLTFKRCKSGLLKLANNPNPIVLDALLGQLYFLDNQSELKYQCLVCILENPHHRTEYYQHILHEANFFDRVLTSQFDNIHYYWAFLKKFAITIDTFFDDKCFYQSLALHIANDKKALEKFIIECLTDFNGKIRYLGNIILNKALEVFPHLQLYEKGGKLSSTQELILILSIQKFYPVQFIERFRLIIPLFKTKHENTLRLLLKFIQQSFDSHAGLLEVIKEELNGEEAWQKQLISILEQQELFFKETQEKKFSLKELSPLYTQAKWFNIHQIKYQKRMSDLLQKSMEEELAIFALAQHVAIVKGSGWTIEGQEDISLLNRYQHSVTVPASLYQAPETDQIQLYMYFTTNWENENECQKWLKKYL